MTFSFMCLFLVLLPNLGIWIGSIATELNLEWYKSLDKSVIAAPGWMFQPVWTMLYCLMGFASFVIWEKRTEKSFIPICAYIVQLLINWLWVWIFFGTRDLLMSLVGIIMLDMAVVVCVVTFAMEQAGAAALLLPYVAWLIYVTYLIAYIYMNN